VASFLSRLACLVGGHHRVLASVRLADGRFLPIAMCDRCGASLN
jgi:hypothetical protein